MKTTFSATIAAFATLGACASIPRDAVGPWEVTGFSASKGHLSSYCSYSFSITRPSSTEAVTCSGSFDAGSSGATNLAYVYAGACDDEAVTWTFSNAANGGGDVAEPAYLTVSWADEGSMTQVGSYTIPGDQISISLNEEPNPYDNDVAYVGPKDFEITSIGA
ncbi:hypothetical protein F5Y15DRAFT_342188 [Xylariaceae sp. FL0016]|nr:hypothetical protein F5Y15DRAFT_342188 [Xylariaceae sp. FL0016]